MVAAVITVGLAVVAWTANSFSKQQEEIGAFFSSKSEAMKENFVIEDVWFIPYDSVNVTVRNIGTVDLTVEAIYFNGTDHLSEDRSIAIGDAETITITWTWQIGHYYIVVASARGQQVREFYSTSG
jgi:uncharacterized DUF497 family protein